MTASATSTTARFDALRVEDLRNTGAMKWLRHPDDVLGAWISEMDFGTAPEITDALTAYATGGGSFGYATPAQLRGVSEACVAWQARDYNVAFDPDLVHPVGDIVKAFEITIGLLTTPGSAVVVPTPGYLSFLQVPPAFGREVVQVDMVRDGARWTLDLDRIGAAFRAGAGLLALCNPHNPLGLVHTREELEAVADLADAHGARVFADEVHAPFVFDGEHIPFASVSPAAARVAVTATSASKGWNLQGLKCAQILFSNEHDEDLLAPVVLPQTLTASVPGIIANTAAYHDGGPWLAEVVDYLAGNRSALVSLMAEHAPQIRWDVPAGTYMAFLDCRDLGLPSDLTATQWFLQHARVAFNDGEKFGGAGAGHVRLNFATPLPILTEVVARTGRALADLARGA